MINSSSEDVVERVQAITGGKGAYTALDPVGGEFTQLVRGCSNVYLLLESHGLVLAPVTFLL